MNFGGSPCEASTYKGADNFPGASAEHIDGDDAPKPDGHGGDIEAGADEYEEDYVDGVGE